LLRQTKAGDQFGISLVGFRPRQTRISKSSDGCRVDETDETTGFKQKQSERLAVSAGRFQASVQVTNLMRIEPGDKLLEAEPSIGEDFVFSFPVRFD
jgi:hypothetical protein